MDNFPLSPKQGRVTVATGLAIFLTLTATIGSGYIFHSVWVVEHAFPADNGFQGIIVYAIYASFVLMALISIAALVILRGFARVASIMLLGVAAGYATIIPFVYSGTSNLYIYAIPGTYLLASIVALRGWIAERSHSSDVQR